MAQFSANTGDINDAAGPLGSISPEIADLHGQVSGHYSAGAGTPIEGHIDDVMSQWETVLPQFGAAGDGLQSVLYGSSTNYEAADAITAKAAAAHTPEGVKPE